jgi:hypothetical protein
VNDTILRNVDLAELISESFSRVADDLPPLAFNPIPVSDVPDEYIISPKAVVLALSTVHERKSAGPDKIPNWLLKTCAPIISNPVSSNIQRPFDPDFWGGGGVEEGWRRGGGVWWRSVVEECGGGVWWSEEE